MLYWVGIDQPMKMKETSRVVDKKLQVNNNQVCDEDYKGEYIVALHNDTDIPQTINPMERIAQLVVMPYLPVEFNEVDELNDTERGSGGFGSTGKQVIYIKEEKLLYTVKETAGTLGVNVHVVYELIKKGLLPAMKLGSLKIRKETIIDFIIKYEGMDLSDLDNIIELKTVE